MLLIQQEFMECGISTSWDYFSSTHHLISNGLLHPVATLSMINPEITLPEREKKSSLPCPPNAEQHHQQKNQN